MEKKRSAMGYIFILPWLIGFLAFQLFPLGESLILAFSRIVDLTRWETSFVGWNNFEEIFTVNVDFVPAFLETIRITFVYSPFIIVLSLVIAILLNKDIKGRSVFRVIFFLPVLLGTGAVMAKLGSAANILKIPESLEWYIQYYFSQDFAQTLQSILEEVVRMFWKTGVQVIICLGGLQAIPTSYYEAARVDNANGWDMLWKITLPMLSPIIFLISIYTVIDSFRDERNPISKLIINEVFKNSKYTMGSAMGWIYFVVSMFFVGLIVLIFGRLVNYEK